MRVATRCSGFRTGSRQKFKIPNTVREMLAPVAFKINNLEPTVWKHARTAKALQVPKTTLHDKIRRHGLSS